MYGTVHQVLSSSGCHLFEAAFMLPKRKVLPFLVPPGASPTVNPSARFNQLEIINSKQCLDVGTEARSPMIYRKRSGQKDSRRKHSHYLVTVTYGDGQTFGRVYIDAEKAERFAQRQKKSPVVKQANVKKLQ